MDFNCALSVAEHDLSHEEGEYASRNIMAIALIAGVGICKKFDGLWIVVTGGLLSIKVRQSLYVEGADRMFLSQISQ